MQTALALPGTLMVLILSAALLVACRSEAETRPTAFPPSDPPTVLLSTSTIKPSSPENEATDEHEAATIVPLPPEGQEPEPELAALQEAQREPLNRVALAHALAGQPDQTVVRTTPPEVSVGEVQPFWVSNITHDHNDLITAELRYAGPVVLMYVEQGLSVDEEDLEHSARAFEQTIYPRTRALFGSEWQPGVDGDPRITILHAHRQGDSAIGYFSPRDSVPRSANRFSNERDMFTMKILPDHPSYLSVLAHEFQHMIHWNEQRRSATWFNEGCATLNQDLLGFGESWFAQSYLTNPDTQLTAWGASPSASIAHYGAANLFMRYLYEQYAHQGGLIALIRADASNNLDAFVAQAAARRPDITSFGTLVGDWAVANLLNNPQIADGRYAYVSNPAISEDEDTIPPLPQAVRPEQVQMGETSGTVHQFGVDYLSLPRGSRWLTFTGTTTVSLVGTMPQGNQAWWSGRGDHSMATLTRPFDLRTFETAVLRFRLWYELEHTYDYGFVTASTDGGETWQTLEGRHTTSADPQGANYGHGWTGISGRPGVDTDRSKRGEWVEEAIDLTPFAGTQVLVRFWQVSDEAISEAGMLLDTIRLCHGEETSTCSHENDVETGTGGWQASGFVQVDGDLPQKWELRMVRIDSDGTIRVEPLLRNPPPASVKQEPFSATAALEADEQVVLVVIGATPFTTEPARYRLVVR
ncbi:MAG: hypothetical protein HC884_03800 [Chloroflexaceae bacterium]|nr:hypothetical protein [Chloroflexaceae bacterium]